MNSEPPNLWTACFFVFSEVLSFRDHMLNVALSAERYGILLLLFFFSVFWVTHTEQTQETRHGAQTSNDTVFSSWPALSSSSWRRSGQSGASDSQKKKKFTILFSVKKGEKKTTWVKVNRSTLKYSRGKSNYHFCCLLQLLKKKICKENKIKNEKNFLPYGPGQKSWHTIFLQILC